MNINNSTNVADVANVANVAEATAQSSVIIDMTGTPPESPHRVDEQSECQQVTQPDYDHDQNQRKKTKHKQKRERRNGEKTRASMNLNQPNAADESAQEISLSTPQRKAFASLPKDPKEWDLDF